MENCLLCEIWNEKPEGVFMNFSTYLKGDKMYAIWYQHETKAQMKLCKCKVDYMQRVLEIRAKAAFGVGSFSIEYDESGGHLHWVARRKV